MTTNRENGIYYTPPDLAEYLATPLMPSADAEILDPAYGEGALLLAAERIHNKVPGCSSISLFGCDTKPVNGLLKHLPEANLRKIDFFDFPVEIKFDLVLTNPPYVRHHLLDADTLKKYRGLFSEISILKNTADLWAYFMIKSALHLKPNGSLGAILPWAFLQADYAQPLREWLFNNFQEIKLLALSDKYFEQAEERVILVWLKGYTQKCTSLQIGSAKDITQPITFTDLTHENWNSNRVLYRVGDDIETTLATLKNVYGFTPLGDHVDVKIGVVTGADKYFIMSSQKVKENGIDRNHLIPILTTSKSFPDLINKGPRSLKKLVRINKKHYTKYRSFISKGIAKKYQTRAHSTLRTPWYAVKIGKTPDAFFPYRTSKIPYLLLNTHNIQCTNSIHRIYFKEKFTQAEKQWIQVSLLSLMGQLSLESNSKTYGRGLLKIEPNSLKKALVIKRNDLAIRPIYMQVMQLLAENDKLQAVEIATNFIAQYLNIPLDILARAKSALTDFQSLRLQ